MREKQTRGCGPTTITQAACGLQLLAKSSHSLRPRRLSGGNQSLCCLPASPTPTPHHTHKCVEGLHDWAVATDEILESDSLLSLNTPD